MAMRSIGFLAVLLLAGCGQTAAPTPAAEIESAVNNDLNITGADDDRADRLDEKAGELDQAADATGGPAAGALRNEARADLAAADAARAQGAADGTRAEDRDERRDGLLNSN